MLSAVAGGIAAGAVASVVAKEMCKKNKKTSEEKEAKSEQSFLYICIISEIIKNMIWVIYEKFTHCFIHDFVFKFSLFRNITMVLIK